MIVYFFIVLEEMDNVIIRMLEEKIVDAMNRRVYKSNVALFEIVIRFHESNVSVKLDAFV